MEIVIWILVIIAVIAVIVWLLRRNSQNGSDAGADTAQHPGHQPGSGSNDPIVETAPPVSSTAAAGPAGAAAAASVADSPRGHADTAADDPGFGNGGSEPSSASAPDRPGEHTTMQDADTDESYESSLEQDDHASGGERLSPGGSGGVSPGNDRSGTMDTRNATVPAPDAQTGTDRPDVTAQPATSHPAPSEPAERPADTAAGKPEEADANDDTEGGSNPGTTKRP